MVTVTVKCETHYKRYGNGYYLRGIKLPKPGQRSVSIPEYIWQYAEAYFKRHKEELRQRGIKSVTRLICVWIQEKALKERAE